MSPADSDVIDLKVMMTLGAFNVLVCDQSSNMADIKIQGTESDVYTSRRRLDLQLIETRREASPSFQCEAVEVG